MTRRESEREKEKSDEFDTLPSKRPKSPKATATSTTKEINK